MLIRPGLLFAILSSLTVAVLGTAQSSAVQGTPVASTTSLVTPAAPVVVTRYAFDTGVTTGRVVDLSGKGGPATVRAADNGRITQGTLKTGHYAIFPAKCALNARVCPRAILEAPNDPDLNPGTRRFRWAASIRITSSQVTDSSNIMQKGLNNAESQWKMQVGPAKGKVQCVVVGQGSTQSYVVRSSNSVTDGQWHKVQCERSGTSLAIAVDGVIRGRLVIPANLTISNTRPLRLGGPNLSNTSDLYHGWLDDVSASLG